MKGVGELHGSLREGREEGEDVGELHDCLREGWVGAGGLSGVDTCQGDAGCW